MKTSRIAWVTGVVGVLGALVGTLPASKVDGFDIAAFSRLPILEGGRIKPLDTVARNALLMIRGQQTVRQDGHTVDATTWLLDVLFRPGQANLHESFVVDDPDVLGVLGLRQTSNRYVSFQTMTPHLQDVETQANTAHQIDAKARNRFQEAIVQLFDRVFMYYKLQNTVQLAQGPDLAEQMAMVAQGTAPPQGVSMLKELAFFRSLPPAAGQPQEAWLNVGEALARNQTQHPALAAWSRLGAAYEAHQSAEFNAAVAELERLVDVGSPDARRQADNEVFFNRAQPFYMGLVLYVLALLVLAFSWLAKPDQLRSAAFGFLCAGAVVHTAGLVFRIILQGRPPVTNLYSSAIFVGWGAVLLGIILERMYQRGLGTAVASASGFGSLIVAHHLMGDGDTMEMMRAVLDSNFWLATHVTTITIGYSGTFLAGAVAIGYAIRRHAVAVHDAATTKTMVSMAYGIICFSLFFSFVGTVLGGIWADQSWGRFWGWDPKENGALLIVLWNAIILHARWGGYVREKGIMAMATFGAIITSLSWFGVNMLGVGLHSYGFMSSAFVALSAFVGSQLAVMAATLLPPRFWKAQEGTPAPQAGTPATGKPASA